MNPPVVFLVALVTVLAISSVGSGRAFSSPVFEVIGIAMIVVGIWLNARGSRQFERAGTPIRPGSRGGALVTAGVFSVSRNPMYLGMAAILFGAGVSLGSVASLVAVPMFMVVMQRKFIAMEERILDEQFGTAYRDFCERVRRWI